MASIRILSLTTLAACGGGGGGGSSPPPATYSVGGTVSGLYAGQRITLRNNGGDPVTVAGGSDGFAFPTKLAGGAYAVTLDPAGSDRNCVVENGTGTVSGANVTNVSVRCSSVFAFVANTSGTISRYSVGANGQLTSSGSTAGGNPQHVAVHGSGKYAYVANGSGHDVLQFNVGTDGSLTPMSTASVAAGATGYAVRVVLDWRGRAYALNWTEGRIYQYSVGADGALTPMSPAYVAAGTHPSAMVVDGNCNCAIVGEDSAGGSLHVFDINADGSLAFRLSYGANFRTRDIALYSPRGQLWVAGGNENAIQRWTLTAGGALAYAGNVGLNSPRALALGRNGELLWAANYNDNLVRPYQVDAATGALNAVASDVGGDLNGPVSIATDGERVYVVNVIGTISQYAVVDAASGSLTLLTPATVATGTNPSAVALY